MRYAETTAVPIARSRAEIDRLLRDWGASAIQWSDSFEHDTVQLRFSWPFEGTQFVARFDVKLPGKSELAKDAVDGRTGRTSEGKLRKLLDERGKREHRVLLLWLKAALNAVDMGIVTAAALFLPFLQDRSGRTVAQEVLPVLRERLLSGGAAGLLEAPRKRSAP